MKLGSKDMLIKGGVIVLLLIPAFISYKLALRKVEAQPKIVTVDLKGILEEFVVKSAASKLEGAELEKHVKDYTERLDRLTNELAAQENFIIVPKNAVLAGGRDITPEIKSLIAEGYGNAEKD